jgi:hypothetical protein
MHKENKDENKQQESVSLPSETTDGKEESGTPPLDELSDVWRELLGNRVHEKYLPIDTPIPTLDVDPWRALLQASGVEVVDLEHMHLEISDQEVEQILQVMPADPDNRDKSPSGASEDSSSGNAPAPGK